MLAIGAVILITGGVFERPEVTEAEHQHNDFTQPQQGMGMGLQNVQEITELENIVKANPENYDAMLRLAHLLNDSGFDQRAVNYYEQFLAKNPDNEDVLVDLGVSYFEMGNHAKAIENMKKAVSLNPRHQIGYFNLGIVSYDKGSRDEAVEFWKKAVAINPNSEIAKKAESLINNNH